jgi:hypothetical protein
MAEPKFQKCTKCKEFFAGTDGLCSACGSNNIQQKEKCYSSDSDLIELFNEYKKENHIKNSFIDNSHFASIKNIIINKKCGDIYAMLCGLSEIPPAVLWAKQADQLLTEIFSKTPINDRYTFIHAICQFVIDPWNFTTNDMVLLCYYKDFGDLIRNPLFKSKIVKYWTKIKFNSSVLHDLTEFIISECPVCTEKMTSREVICRCDTCGGIVHFDCLKKYFEQTDHTFECILCRSKWEDDDPKSVRVFNNKVMLIHNIGENHMTFVPIMIGTHKIYYKI